MAKELQDKIAWLKKRHADASKIVEQLENDRKLDRSTRAQRLLRDAKKEKLRTKDMIAMMEKL